MKNMRHRSPERPLLSDVRKALPPDRRHLLLRLMPYSYSAPEDFCELQSLVHQCFADPDPQQSAQALVDMTTLFERGLQDVPRRHELIVEVASYLRTRTPGFSFLVAEAEFMARLAMEGVTLDEFRQGLESEGVPLLVGSVRWVLGAPVTIRAALGTLQEAVSALTGRPAEALALIPSRERLAAIRLIRLFCMYGTPRTQAPVKQARLHFFRTLGIPVWRALAEPGFDEPRIDSGMYLEPAIRRLELAITEGAYATDCGLATAVADASIKAAPTSKESTTSTLSEHTFVTDNFPAARDDQDNALLKQYESLRRPMPIATLPSLAELHAMNVGLLAEFPWAGAALDAIFGELKGRASFGGVRLNFCPVLLTGPSGTGKTRLARRLAEVLSIESMSMSLAGMGDAMGILGTARGWSSGQPSPLLRPLLKGRASLLMCFDELDKTANLTRNSTPIESALLSLLEPEEARRWRDPYLQVECDLRPLLYVFTCNQTVHLSAALRSRLRILDVENPTAEQLASVVPYVLRDVELDYELPVGALEGVTISLRALHGISSLRNLRRAVSAAAWVWIEKLASMPKH